MPCLLGTAQRDDSEVQLPVLGGTGVVVPEAQVHHLLYTLVLKPVDDGTDLHRGFYDPPSQSPLSQATQGL